MKKVVLLTLVACGFTFAKPTPPSHNGWFGGFFGNSHSKVKPKDKHDQDKGKHDHGKGPNKPGPKHCKD